MCVPLDNLDIKILSFNVEGLASICDDPEFMSLADKHDICLLTETWRKDDSKLNLSGFWDFSQIRPKHRKAFRHSGGITILVKHHIKPGIKVALSTEGFIWLKMEKTFFNFVNDVFLCASYIPPQYSSRNVLLKTDYFQSLTDACLKFSGMGNIIITGDLNARIGRDLRDEIPPIMGVDNLVPDEVLVSVDGGAIRSSCDYITNAYGKKVIEICQGFNMNIANGRTPGDRLGNFTCFNARGASVVDYVISDKGFFNCITRLLILPPEFSSVHAPLSFTMKCKFSCGKKKEKLLPLPPKFVWDASQTTTLVNLLKQPEAQARLATMVTAISGQAIEPNQADAVTKDLSDLLFTEANKCLKLSKKINRSQTSIKPSTKVWYNANCSSVKKRLQNLARLACKHPKDPYITGKYFAIKKEYKSLIRDAKRSYDNESISKLMQLTNNPKSFWKHLKRVTGTGKSNQNNIISPEVWIDHFSSLNRNNPNDLEETNEHVKNTINKVKGLLAEQNQAHCPILDKELTMAELFNCIKKLKNGKASGCDAVSNEIIKASYHVIAPVLCTIFNKLLGLQRYPVQWATGLIMPLHKAGDLNDPNNFRGITINSCLSKLFTIILNERLTRYCNENNIIKNNQAGFRKGFRTSDQVFTLKTMVDQAFANGEKLYTCFVDFRKAYDTIWRDGLFSKLLDNKVSPRFVKLLQDMYSRLQACIRLPNGISSPFPSLVGLKQGCNLSPILFNIFINDLIDDLDRQSIDPPKLGNLRVNCLLYADDLVLMAESQTGLQKLMDTLENFTKQWHMQINTSKTKCLTFSRGRKPTNPTPMYIGNILIQRCNSYCYLGTVFTESGSLNLAAKTLCDKARSAMFGLLRSLYKNKVCNVTLLFDLFDKMVTPIATYNSEVWGISCFPGNKNNDILLNQDTIYKHPVEGLHIKFIKRILGIRENASNWAAISEVGRFPIIIRIFTGLIKFFSHLQESTSGILLAALKVNIELADRGINTWAAYIKRLVGFCNGTWEGLSTNVSTLKFSSSKLLQNKYLESWGIKKSSLSTDSKLYLYKSLKGDFGRERYLDIRGFKLRNAITKIRLSAHNFPIETGRYMHIAREDRICPLCNNGVGDESHYLLECPHPKLVAVRDHIIEKIESIVSGFELMLSDQKLEYILKMDNPEFF